MKTNPAEKALVRIRVVLVCAALAALVGLEFQASKSLAARIGQATPIQTEAPQVLHFGIYDMMAAAAAR